VNVTLTSCQTRPDRSDIDPLLRGFYAELSPKLVSIGSVAVDTDFWIEDFWRNAEQFLPPMGRIWVARDETGQSVGWGTLRQIRPDAGEMKRLYVKPEMRGCGIARRLVQARIDDARAMGWHHLFADTFRDNVEMQTLYQGMGFRFIEPYPESGVATTSSAYGWTLKFMQLDLD
jgi:putative acetyltransferase